MRGLETGELPSTLNAVKPALNDDYSAVSKVHGGPDVSANENAYARNSSFSLRDFLRDVKVIPT